MADLELATSAELRPATGVESAALVAVSWGIATAETSVELANFASSSVLQLLPLESMHVQKHELCTVLAMHVT